MSLAWAGLGEGLEQAVSCEGSRGWWLEGMQTHEELLTAVCP